MSLFKEDRLENEKNDPTEGSNLKFINVPLTLIALFLGFGITYLALKTDKVTIHEGDSRTVGLTKDAAPAESPAAASGSDVSIEDLMAKGKQVFTTTCQVCHQASGTGLPGAFPPLGGSEWVMESPQRLVAIILHGLQGEITVKGEKFHSVMPPFKDQLSSEDIASVATYVRRSFGNNADPVAVQTVEAVRQKTAERTTSWNGEKELNENSWD